MSRGRFATVLGLAYLGCAPAVSAPTPGPTARTAASAPAAPPAPPVASAPETRLPIRFEELATDFAASDVVHLEIEAPIFGKQIARQKLPDTAIQLRATGWSDRLRLVLLLDDFPPRVFEEPARPIRVGELIPENRELDVGLHWLFASVQTPSGTTLRLPKPSSLAPFAFVPFWVGPVAEDSSKDVVSEGPRIVLVSPRGTFNGDRAADQVLLDFHVLGGSVGPDTLGVKVEVVAESEHHETLLKSNRVMRIAGLPSGDHSVKVSLVGADGQLLSGPHVAAARTITINRDAPVE